MLENNSAQLNDIDCSSVVRADMASSTVGCILITRIKGVHKKETSKDQIGKDETIKHPVSITHRPRSNDYASKADSDPFGNPTLLHVPDRNQDAAVRAAVEES